jgi:MoaA/NifB/PqqE/SkfB family radical SAM enzyme
MSFSIDNVTKFDVEITNKCNARCPGCIRTVNGDSHPLLKQNITEWSLEDFINIFPSKLVNGNEFMFGGTVDDPLMNKNIVPIVEYILENDGILEIQTNTGANTKETFKRLGELSYNSQKRFKVTFSVDGLEKTNHLYRVNVNWNKVLENMTAYIKEKGYCEWEYLVFEHNYNDIDDAKKLAKQLGVNFILRQNVRNTRSWFSKTKVKEEGKIVTKTFEVKTTEKFKHPETVGVTKYNDKLEVTQEEGKSISCKMYHEKSVFIDWNYKVWPCCWFAADNFEQHEYFHMLIDQFGENWNSLKHHSWSEIISHNYYSRLLHESWDGQQSEYYNPTCFKHCGDNGSRQSYKRKELSE